MRLLTLSAFCMTLAIAPALAAQPFALSDSSPNSAEARERFLASYGVNAAIEPSLTQKDRPLFERIEPFLQNNPRGAIREVEAALNAETSPAFYFLLGNLYYQVGEYGQAEQNLRAAIQRFPSFRRAWRTLGLIAIQRGRYGDSIEPFLNVIKLGGGDAQSYGLLAYSYLSERKFQAALSAYEMARMFEPDSIDFRRGQAQALLAMNRANEAAALFDELLQAFPREETYWLAQANAYLQLERFDEAIANIEVVRSFRPVEPSTLFLLGNLHLQNDNHRLALDAYQAALSSGQAPLLEQALPPLEYLTSRGLLTEAEAYFERLKSRLPEDLTAGQARRIALADAVLQLGRGNIQAAETRLLQITRDDPLNATALLELVRLYTQAADYEKAELYGERALGLPEHKAAALVELARMEVQRRNLDRALEYVRAANEISPSAQHLRYIETLENALPR